jgi:putative addiction module component (TIGR02574 family)
MKRDATRLLREALRLSAQDRVALAEALLASLDEDVDDNAEAAWRSEVERRIGELDAGAVSPIPWAEVRRRLIGGTPRRGPLRTEPRFIFAVDFADFGQPAVDVESSGASSDSNV